ncbi:hypothetical protein BHE74_00032190, partial [Ensete ventricosum]
MDDYGLSQGLQFRSVLPVSVCQVTGTLTARYRAVPLKIDRRRLISAVGSRLREKSNVGGRLREKSGRLREKKGRRRRSGKEEKRRRGEKGKKEIPSVVLARGSPAHRRRRHPLFLLRVETERLPARGERSRR